MKRFTLQAALALILYGCSTVPENEVPTQRPGDVHLPPAEIRFEHSTIEIDVDISPASGRVTATMQRRGICLPDTSYALAVNDPRGALSLAPTVHFQESESSVQFEIGYSVSLQPEESYTARISTTAQGGSTSTNMEIVFRRPSAWHSYSAGTYSTGNLTFAIEAERCDFDGGCRYRITAPEYPGFERLMSLYDDESVTVTATTVGIEDFDAVRPTAEIATPEQISAYPLMGLRCHHNSEEHYYGLSLTYTQGPELTPRYDVVRFDCEQDRDWRRLDDAEIIDGWLVGVVSIDLLPPPVPSTVPWNVEAWQSANDPSRLRLCGIYRVASPLSVLNGCARMAAVEVLLNPTYGTAKIVPTFAGFTNSDMFGTLFTISGSGTYITNSEGNIVVDIPVPLHNGNGPEGPWSTVHPTRIVLKATL